MFIGGLNSVRYRGEVTLRQETAQLEASQRIGDTSGCLKSDGCPDALVIWDFVLLQLLQTAS